MPVVVALAQVTNQDEIALQSPNATSATLEIVSTL